MRNTNMTGRRPLDGYVKSTFSDQGGQCVLVRRLESDSNVFIRDSKYQRDPNNDPLSEPILEMPATAWDSFVSVVRGTSKEQKVPPGVPNVAPLEEGQVQLAGYDGITLRFTPTEWAAFIAGLNAGEFRPQPFD